MRQFIFYDSHLESDDVFTSSTTPLIQKTEGCKKNSLQGKPIRNATEETSKSRDPYITFPPTPPETPIKSKNHHGFEPRSRNEDVGLGLNFDIDLNGHTTVKSEEAWNYDELDSPPLSPVESIFEGPEDVGTPDLFQHPRFACANLCPVSPPASPLISSADKNLLKSEGKVYRAQSGAQADLPSHTLSLTLTDDFTIDDETLQLLESDYPTCSNCKSENVDSKHFTKLCDYMVEHGLHHHHVSHLDTLRTFRPFSTIKMIALVTTDKDGNITTDFFSVQRNTQRYHPSPFGDFFEYQRAYGDEIKIQFQERCEKHGTRNVTIWVFEPSNTTNEGVGTLMTLTKRLFAREKKRVLARKLKYDRL